MTEKFPQIEGDNMERNDFMSELAANYNISESDAQTLYDIYGDNNNMLSNCELYSDFSELGASIVNEDERYIVLPSGKIIFFDNDPW